MPVSTAVSDMFNQEAPQVPTDSPPVNQGKPKRYNKYGDEIQDE